MRIPQYDRLKLTFEFGLIVEIALLQMKYSIEIES